jgi:Family of unknown function (DUF6404)
VSNEDVQARLARIAQAKPSPGAQDQPLRVDRDDRARTRAEKIQIVLKIAEARGIGISTIYPPVFRLLAALGLQVKPLPYFSTLALFVMGVMGGLGIFGTILWFGIGDFIARGPVAGLHRAGWPGVWLVSLGMGVAMPIMVRLQTRKMGLPRWDEL